MMHQKNLPQEPQTPTKDSNRAHEQSWRQPPSSMVMLMLWFSSKNSGVFIVVVVSG
jgi:hypothetical protein